MESIQQTISEMTEMFHSKMAEFQLELQQTASNQSGSPAIKLSMEFQTFKQFVLSVLKSLQAQVELLTSLHDQVEMRTRQKILLVHGIPEDKKDPVQVTVELMRGHLKVQDFEANSIKHCHRMGRPGVKPRPILIKFQDVATRKKIWNAKTSLKNSRITLSEFLTHRRRATFLAACERYGINKCWSRDSIIIVIGPDGSHHRVCSMMDLDAISSPSTVVVAPTAPASKEAKNIYSSAVSRPKRAAVVKGK